MRKSVWIPLMASFGTMILLYIIGYIADIEFLIFKISLSETEIALLPIAVGMLVGFISERMIKFKSQK
ncbi:ATPase [Neobacillus niacini]|uniref:ATPase n=1 Tax=Neobacillus niacini TaxID=86668 RepID=UPI0030030731